MSFHSEITENQASLIEQSKIFFVASANPAMKESPKGEGPVNVSPKGGTKLHIIDSKTVAYLDYPGSGNETAYHIQEGGPVTLMVMSMTSVDAAIVRLYGRGSLEPEGSELFQRVAGEPAQHLAKKARQVFKIRVEKTQTSCGYGVPVFQFVGDRTREQRGRTYRD